MPENLASIIIGCICIVIGILNTKGNLGSLHAYHRKRVREQDLLPFGRTVGAGTICCGAGMLLYGVLGLIAKVATQDMYMWIGTVLLGICLAVGLLLSFYAMFKYNKGIF